MRWGRTSHERLTVLVCALCGLAGCAALSAPPQPIGAPAEPPLITPWGYPLDHLDRTVRPGDDFFAFANGTWLADAPIPPDRSGIGFSQIMRDRNEDRFTAIVEDLLSRPLVEAGARQQIRDLYLSFMDETGLAKKGLRPARQDLQAIQAAQTHADIARLMARPALGLQGPFRLIVQADARRPTEYAVWASHSGLGLPDRTYYQREEDELAATRAAYLTYLVDALDLLGRPAATDRAEKVFALEAQMAAHHWSQADRRDANLTYNPMAPETLVHTAPGFPWRAFVEAHGFDPEREIVVRELAAFAPLAALFAATPVEIWQDYLLIQYFSANAPFLNEEAEALQFAFFEGVLKGQHQQRPRQARALKLLNTYLNQAVGKIYVEMFFSPDAKRQMEDMFANIKRALSARIDRLDWMSDITKISAQKKLAQMTAKIGYPDVWRTYDGLEIRPDDLLGNIKRARMESHSYNLANLVDPVDTGEWFIGPQTVNAFYSPQRNEAFIPAGYIQSPLFDPNADAAINYGAIGSIIGHEIGHGFDDQGSKFDANGALSNWWTVADRVAFDRLGDRLARQFDQYEVLPGLTVNGRQTLGENIGDLAGMTLAYHAYKLHLGRRKAPVLDGFTGEQRLFLGRAQARRFKRTEESLRRRLLSAPHSPMALRVNGIVRNMDEWYDAFDIKKGDLLYLPKKERIRIW